MIDLLAQFAGLRTANRLGVGRWLRLAAASLALALAACGTVQKENTWISRPAEPIKRLDLVFVRNPLLVNGTPIPDDTMILKRTGYSDFPAMFLQVGPTLLQQHGLVATLTRWSGCSNCQASWPAPTPVPTDHRIRWC